MTDENFNKLIIEPFNNGAILLIKISEESETFYPNNQLYDAYYKIAIADQDNDVIIEVTQEAIDVGIGWYGDGSDLDSTKKYWAIKPDDIESVKGYFSFNGNK